MERAALSRIKIATPVGASKSEAIPNNKPAISIFLRNNKLSDNKIQINATEEVSYTNIPEIPHISNPSIPEAKDNTTVTNNAVLSELIIHLNKKTAALTASFLL